MRTPLDKRREAHSTNLSELGVESRLELGYLRARIFNTGSQAIDISRKLCARPFHAHLHVRLAIKEEGVPDIVLHTRVIVQKHQLLGGVVVERAQLLTARQRLAHLVARRQQTAEAVDSVLVHRQHPRLRPLVLARDLHGSASGAALTRCCRPLEGRFVLAATASNFDDLQRLPMLLRADEG